MGRHKKIIGTIAFVLLVGGTAMAQPKDAGKVKVYDFSGDTIEGDLVKPEGTDLNARFREALVTDQDPQGLHPEIIKSAEAL